MRKLNKIKTYLLYLHGNQIDIWLKDILINDTSSLTLILMCKGVGEEEKRQYKWEYVGFPSGDQAKGVRVESE